MPTSSYGNEVEVDVDVGEAIFLLYDESSLNLFLPANVTTNVDEGIYHVQISLTD